jgi:hypothetical protein
MSDAYEFGLLAEGYQGLRVLKPNQAHGLEARRGDAHELVEEDAAVRVASAFRREPGLAELCGIMIPHTSANR